MNNLKSFKFEALVVQFRPETLASGIVDPFKVEF